MSEQTVNEKSENGLKPTTQEEPSLFAEKNQRTGKRKMNFVFVILISVIGFFFWPRGYIEGEGIAQAERFARIDLTSPGVLKELIHQKGDAVQKGEVLARFENPEFTRKLEERRISLEMLNHDKTRLTKQVEFLEKEKENTAILCENGVIGRIQLEKATLAHLHAAEELAMREKEIESAEKEIQFLMKRIESLELRAPFDGMLLTDAVIKVGNLFKEGDFVLEFADPKSFFLEIQVPEKKMENVKLGSAAKVRFRAFPWRIYSGEVSKIGSRITEEVEKVFNVKHVIACEIKLYELPPNLKYGMRAWVRIGGSRQADSKTDEPQKPAQIIERFIDPEILGKKKAGI
ncbi:MAG: hypothetical protein A3G33_08235 [Omnitrophica bacterium RIFCSPLOWO2_12_FULL_44_17]|uniref:CzcB-like barrel-sandwich hybrid domain-containing protein n=1 Tax=Candidatus Danuiimicrobium aquiferis TaxID=1801832 RepID=A0A1G1KWK1_9BACT|nr:MAG: hypothetical protein A3B72_03450 [Omnitrophica bacterium RIFCSPHIGHO2_02_FULL_45_28]OGW92610.1 MAG: hypothetical protein A3E74_02480 [Omnitrophica bacterium RIFCSPHIGHO2_12_FULL_44_12]OGW97152.1 MAG: hypothetical protein A3G33_08235 [Omnitrophica bacterium RIFCSPLOWO2_12_FULL_44_17]OGX02212.1 MAG: hypothetical protein A3J12_08010 [Omnitrophica bacterium RIFCSPLOWO2_02_FULL_44_11]